MGLAKLTVVIIILRYLYGGDTLRRLEVRAGSMFFECTPG